MQKRSVCGVRNHKWDFSIIPCPKARVSQQKRGQKERKARGQETRHHSISWTRQACCAPTQQLMLPEQSSQSTFQPGQGVAHKPTLAELLLITHASGGGLFVCLFVFYNVVPTRSTTLPVDGHTQICVQHKLDLVGY